MINIEMDRGSSEGLSINAAKGKKGENAHEEDKDSLGEEINQKIRNWTPFILRLEEQE